MRKLEAPLVANADFVQAVVLTTLKAHGIDRFCVEYSGGGDSGGIDSSDLPEEIESQTILVPSGRYGALVVEQSIGDLIDTYMADKYMPSGFENNEGGFGTISIDINAGEAEVNHVDYVNETSVETIDQARGLRSKAVQAYFRAVQLALADNRFCDYTKSKVDASDIEKVLLSIEDNEDETFSQLIFKTAGGNFCYTQSDVEYSESDIIKIYSDLSGDSITFNIEAEIVGGVIDRSTAKFTVYSTNQAEMPDNHQFSVNTSQSYEHEIFRIDINLGGSTLTSRIDGMDVQLEVCDGVVCLKQNGHTLNLCRKPESCAPSALPIRSTNDGIHIYPLASITGCARTVICMGEDVALIEYDLYGLCMTNLGKDGQILGETTIPYSGFVVQDVKCKILDWVIANIDQAVVTHSLHRHEVLEYLNEAIAKVDYDILGQIKNRSTSKEIISLAEHEIIRRNSALASNEDEIAAVGTPRLKARI